MHGGSRCSRAAHGLRGTRRSTGEGLLKRSARYPETSGRAGPPSGLRSIVNCYVACRPRGGGGSVDVPAQACVRRALVLELASKQGEVGSHNDPWNLCTVCLQGSEHAARITKTYKGRERARESEKGEIKTPGGPISIRARIKRLGWGGMELMHLTATRAAAVH